MNVDYSDRPADGDTAELLRELGQRARDLDAEAYPGVAWSAVERPRRRQPFGGNIAPWLAVAAASLAFAVFLGTRFPSRIESLVDGPRSVAHAPLPADFSEPANSPGQSEPAFVPLLVVEDLDSYSIIDLSTGAPVVTFATKESCSPACVVPVLPDAPSPTTI